MIQLTLAWFVFIYLALFLAGVLLLWIGYEMLRKRLSSSISHQTIFCRICGMKLVDLNTSTLLRCPKCGSLSEHNTQGGL
ncbi:MAG: hypothetical protein A3F67_10185 [Verrucomicrobia bacterium RIFCSPHIGHO2_12_FULL_41_10]|nr:MAG: hypothetical protein A3F67_10185 [Verrucomicrobia bacterium RIFCSPHIGHO2_12_FULL_41_10]HLB33931.1 hypothetical protein [Chthoniobacterales bacterium]